jgi:hypothetical protein
VKIIVTVDTGTGEETTTVGAIEMLPAEQVESAAARVRPIFLKRDKVHYDDVLNAINSALKGRTDADEDRSVANNLRSRFRAADPDYPETSQGKRWDGGFISNKQLSGAWLYGHLLHEDEKRRSYTEPLALEEAYISATKTVCLEMIAVVTTLHLIERLQVKGWLSLPETVFTDAVTINASSWTQPGQVMALLAPKDTPLPESLDKDLLESEVWKPVTEVFPLPGSPPSENEHRSGPS